jgi:hypothetical protein
VVLAGHRVLSVWPKVAIIRSMYGMSTTSSSSPAAAEDQGTGQPVPVRNMARNPAQYQLRNMTRVPGGLIRAR